MPRSTSTDQNPNTRPTWNSSPPDLPGHLAALEQHLLGADPNFRQLWLSRSVMYRTTTYVTNATQARQIENKTFPTDYSFAEPAPYFIAVDVSLAPLAELLPPPLETSTRESPGSTETPEGAAPTTALTPTPTVAPRATSYIHKLSPEEERLGYQLGPRYVDKVDSDLLEEILQGVLDLQERIDRRRQGVQDGKPSGIALLKALHEEAEEYRSDDMRAQIEADMADLMEDGLADASVLSFNEWRNAYTLLNNTLGKNEGRVSDGVIAKRLVTVVSRVSDKVDNKLDAKIESKNASGNLDLTIQVIKKILAEAESKARQAARSASRGRSLLGKRQTDEANDGFNKALADAEARAERAESLARALAAKEDPVKQRQLDENARKKAERDSKRPKIDSNGKKSWHEGMDACRHCKKRGHLNANCPDKPPEKPREGRSNLSRGELSEHPEEEASLALFANGKCHSVDLSALQEPDALLHTLVSSEGVGGKDSLRPVGRSLCASGTTETTTPVELQSDYASDEDDEGDEASVPELRPVLEDDVASLPARESRSAPARESRSASRPASRTPSLVSAAPSYSYSPSPTRSASPSRAPLDSPSPSPPPARPSTPPEQHAAGTADDTPDLEGPRSSAWLRRRWYVLPNGPIAGIYYGAWDGPEHIRLISEGVAATSAAPTSRRARDIDEAVGLCAAFRVPPVFKGPNSFVLPSDATDRGPVVIGTNLATYEQPSFHLSVEAHLAAAERSRELASAATAPAEGKHAAQPVPTDTAPCKEHDYDLLEALPLPAPLRRRVADSAFATYRYSNFEGVHEPPNMTSRIRKKPFSDRSSGRRLVTAAERAESRVADYVRIHAGTDEFASIRATKPLVAGSEVLRSSVTGLRSALSDCLSFATTLPDADGAAEDEVIARMAYTLTPVFGEAHAQALALPVVRLCGIEVPTPIIQCIPGVVSLLKDPGARTALDPTANHDNALTRAIAPAQADQRIGASLSGVVPPTGPSTNSSTRAWGGNNDVDVFKDVSTKALVKEFEGRALIGRRDKVSFDDNSLNGRTRVTRRHKSSTTSKPVPSSRTLTHAEIKLILDSGCTWHAHFRRSDFINFVSHSETKTMHANSEVLVGIAGQRCDVIGHGDLPVYALDSEGNPRLIVLKNVRLVPSFQDTLVSVDQLWEESSVEARFAGHKKVYVPAKDGSDGFALPFQRRDGVFSLRARSAAEHARQGLVDCSAGRALAAGASPHRAGSTAHISRLPADEAILALHHRLHLPGGALSRLSKIAADVPESVSRGQLTSTGHLTEANATRLSHRNDLYEPSYPGRLIHADIVGPFVSSHGQNYKYALILVDDHSRLKAAYFLKRKSEALRHVRAYVASMNALISKGSSAPRYAVGTLHTDNAGEFLSKDFSEFLDTTLLEHSTCPPYVHSLNGVAERAIRTILEHVRAALLLSNAPKSFWTYAMEQAVDVINRTTGPPRDARSSFEVVLGVKPKIMSILPFGCRAYPVKSQPLQSKTRIEPRAWKGINLGRMPSVPGAYSVWVPSQGKVVHTSDVYFDEGLMPWRAAGDQRIGPSVPIAPAFDEQAANTLAHGNGLVVDSPLPDAAESLEEAYDEASRARASPGRSRNTVLLLFSGPKNRPDGLNVFLNKLGFECVMVDLLHGDNVLNDEFYADLLSRAESGEFFCIFAAPPCSTVSIARFFDSPSSNDGGPPPVRARAENHLNGLPNIPESHRRELNEANEIFRRTARILAAGFEAGTQYILENPSDHGDEASPHLFVHQDHAPLWLLPCIVELRKRTGGELVTFPMCAFGAEWQKYTTLMYSGGFARWLLPLSKLTCTHGFHSATAGGHKSELGWNSRKTSAYPANFNLYASRAIGGLKAEKIAEPVTVSARRSRVGSVDERVDVVEDDTPDEEEAPPAAPSASYAPAPSPLVNVPSHQPAVSPVRPLLSALDAAASSAPPVAPAPAEPVATHQPDHPVEPTIAQRLTRVRTAARFADVSELGGGANRPGFARSAIAERHPRIAAKSPAVLFRGPRSSIALDSKGSVARSARALLSRPAAIDPRNHREAMVRDAEAGDTGWRDAELAELANHRRANSFLIKPSSEKPRHRSFVKFTWVYKTKRDGTKKARLCVQGCSQVPGVDFDQTFCGAMRPTSLRAIAAISAARGYNMRRWDFVAAYLQGELLAEEVVYCALPAGGLGDDVDHSHDMCVVMKPIYGMAQAGRRWQRSLFPWLIEYGFKQCHSDKCVFTLTRVMQTPEGPREESLIVGVYVDDLQIAYLQDDSNSLYADFTKAMHARWNVDDEGEIADLLGVEFKRDGDDVLLTQTAYILKMVAEHCPDGVPSSVQANSTPCEKELVQHVADALADRDDRDLALVKLYQSLVGALLYCATHTRPDVAYAVGMLCRCMARPTERLMQHALRVLHYLHVTRDLGLRYSASEKQIYGMSDADWAVEYSTMGYVFMMHQAALSWSSKKQASVALSTCEAEIMAASESAKEAVHLSGLAEEFGVSDGSPMDLYVDNKSAIDLAYNPEHHQRTKHIARRHFYVRDLVEDMTLRVPFVASADNIADFFTKPLPPKSFFPMRDRIMNVVSA